MPGGVGGEGPGSPVLPYPDYGQFWLWVVGAFEVVRTMAGAKACFSQRVKDELGPLKKTLAFLRMPFAKQEYPGGGKKIGTEASVIIYLLHDNCGSVSVGYESERLAWQAIHCGVWSRNVHGFVGRFSGCGL